MNRNLMSFDDDDESNVNDGEVMFKLRKVKKKRKKKKKTFRQGTMSGEEESKIDVAVNRRKKGRSNQRAAKSFQTFEEEDIIEGEEDVEEEKVKPMEVVDEEFEGDYLARDEEAEDAPLVVQLPGTTNSTTTTTNNTTPSSLTKVLLRLKRARTDASRSERTTNIQLAEAKKSLERANARVKELSESLAKEKPRFEHLQLFRSFVRGLCGMLREIAPKIARLREEAILSTKPSVSSSFRPKDVSCTAWYEKPSENTLQSLVLTPPPTIVPKKANHPVVAKLLEDAREDLQSLDSISAKCLDLKTLYRKDFANAFVDISMPELFAVYAEMILLQDSNLFLHHENINAIEQIKESLSPWKTIDSEDEETQRIGNVYQRTMKILISNLLNDSIKYYYDPASVDQTDRAIRIYNNTLISQSPANATFDSLENTIVKCLEIASGRVTNGSLVQSLNARRGGVTTDRTESDRALSIHFARLLKILITSNRWVATISNLKDRVTSVRRFRARSTHLLNSGTQHSNTGTQTNNERPDLYSRSILAKPNSRGY